MEITNPILHRELRHALLSKRLLLTQWLFVAVLAAVVWLAWPRTPKLQVERIVVSQQLFALFWGGLYFSVSVMAAALSAVAITREKETGSFELLCTAGIATSRVLLGKFLSVVVFLLLLVVSSIPVTASCYLMGGVSWTTIGWQYLDLAVATLLYGGLGLACSSYFDRNHRALSIAFALTLPLAAWSVASQDAKHWIEGIGLLTLLLRIDKIIERVRRPYEKSLPQIPHGQTIQITVDPNSAMDRLFIPHREHKPLSDTKNPVYEREWIEESEAGGRAWWHFLLRFNIGLAVLVTVFLFFGRFWLADYTSRVAPGQYDTMLARYADFAQLAFFSYLIIVAVLIGPAQSANVISKERERQTADLLLTTLLKPRTIVMGKWRLSLRSSFHLLVLLVLPLLPGLVLIFFGKSSTHSVGETISTGLCGLAVVAMTLITLTTIGAYCSLVCKSSGQALSAAYAVAVGWFIGPVVLYYILTRFSELPPASYAWTTYATPFLSFFSMSGSRFFSNVAFFEQPWILGAVYLGLTALVCAVLLAITIFGFDRLWKRG